MTEKLLAEFQRLSEKRDLAAYNAVNAIQFVLSFWEAQTFEDSRQMLQAALEQFQQSDREITEFHHLLVPKKENHSNGNHTTAA